ncbi:MAG: transposase [Candidatus Methanomethyliaceae archaeon]
MEIYHVLNRGVDKRIIFFDEKDYLRFIHDLYEFNDEEPAMNTNYFFNKFKNMDLRSQYIANQRRKNRKMIVKIFAFCLMPNHYHLMLSPIVKDGITKFMRKLNIGYAKYFNEKYGRVGTLFERRYKAIPITKESHFIYLPTYIHLNPLDLKFPEWRNKEIRNYKEAMKFLESYRWSSFLDYIGKKNFPSITQREFLNKIWGGPKEIRKNILRWLKEMDFEEMKEITLE